jgi:hypothetical protein
MSEWVRAAEVQLHEYRWLTSELGQRWSRGWVRAEVEAEPTKGNVYALLMHAEPMKLLTADAIWVAPEICDVIDVARESFEPESLEREDFLTHTGFCYFAKPLYMLDRNKKKVSVGAISWCPTVFKGKDDEPAEKELVLAEDDAGARLAASAHTLDQYESNEERWGMAICLYSSAYSAEDDFASEHAKWMQEFNAPELMPLHLTAIEFGDTLDEGHLLDESGRYTGADEWWKTVQTTLRLMQQRVVVAEDARLPRATRRRGQAQGQPLSEVTVIRLRKTSTRHEAEEPSGRTLTHRHLRDSFWRSQWYPSVQRHRQIWIAPTVVGDESLPLVIKKRYYKWDR